MPIARDETFPDSLGNLADAIRRRVEPVTRRLPIVGPHTSAAGNEFYTDALDRGLDIIAVDAETRDHIHRVVGPGDLPPFAVHTIPDDEMHAEAQPGEAPPPDVLHTRRYDP